MTTIPSTMNSIEENKTIDHMKITDVHQFCLEHICMYLDLNDLLNLADANKYLKLATKNFFVLKYGVKSIVIDQRFSNAFRPNFNTNQTHTMENDAVRIYNLKMCFQILRCFGSTISELVLDYNYHEIDKLPLSYQVIINYMHEFCMESLKKLVLHPVASLKYFTKFFENVEKLEIGKRSLLENRLTNVFPNVRLLEFDDYSYTGVALVHFPHLQHLKMPLFDSQKNAASSILRSNPQLKSLHIRSAGFDFFQENIEHLQNIESLHIDLQPYRHPQFNGNPLYLQNIKKLEMIFMYSIYSGSLKPIIPFSFDRLKEFTIGGISDFNDSIYTFLVTHPTIEKLVLRQKNLIHKSEFIKLQNALPFLVEIILPFSELSINCALSLLSTFKSLKKLSFVCSDSLDEARLICGEKWKIKKSLNPLKEIMFTLTKFEI